MRGFDTRGRPGFGAGAAAPSRLRTGGGSRVVQLKDKIKTTLSEGRMLILGAQVLLGFQFRSVLEPRFDGLPEHAQYLKLVGLGLMVLAAALLMWPGAYHQIVERGEDTHEIYRFATRVFTVALLPFALGLGADFFIAFEAVFDTAQGVVAGAAAVAVALFFWYVFEAMRRPQRRARVEEEKAMSEQDEGPHGGETETKTKIEQVLTEIRVVLPGAQALLGFQFVTILMESFVRLPDSSQYVHVASLSLIALAVVLMMTPAAYHRLVEQGEQTEHFHRLASRLMLASMVPLALGIAGDFFVVVRKVTDSEVAAAAAALASLALFYGMWFGYTLYRKSHGRAATRAGFRETART